MLKHITDIYLSELRNESGLARVLLFGFVISFGVREIKRRNAVSLMT